MTLLEESIIVGGTDIGVFGQRQADYMHECMVTLGYNPVLSRDESEFCSLEEIESRIARG